jgi:hypothetical protein
MRDDNSLLPAAIERIERLESEAKAYFLIGEILAGMAFLFAIAGLVYLMPVIAKAVAM